LFSEAAFGSAPSLQEIDDRLAALHDRLKGRSWREFQGRAEDVLQEVTGHLQAARVAEIERLQQVEAARLAAWPWRNVRILLAGAALCTALVWAGMKWPLQLQGLDPITEEAIRRGERISAIPVHRLQPFIELSKMIASALIGALVREVVLAHVVLVPGATPLPGWNCR